MLINQRLTASNTIPSATIRSILVLLLILVGPSAFSQETLAVPSIYTVKPRDTLSGILYTNDLCPIYGKEGLLEMTFALNKEINPLTAVIYPGQNIYLPDFSRFGELIQRCSTLPMTGYEKSPSAEKKASTPVVPETTASAPIVDQTPTAEVSESTPPAAPTIVDKNSFYLAPRLSFVNIDSTDKASNVDAEFVSNLGYGLLGGWIYQWTERGSSVLELSYDWLKFKESDTRTINNREQNIFSSSLGYQYTTDFLTGLFNIGYQGRIVNRSTGTNELSLNQINVPSVGLGAKKTLLNFSRFNFNGILNYSYLFPTKTSTYDLNSGREYSVGFEISENEDLKLFKYPLAAFVTYKKSNLNLETIDEDQASLLFGLSVFWQ